MKKIIFLSLICLFIGSLASAQAIVKGSGVVYTNGVPAHIVNFNQDSELAIDTVSGLWYERSRDGLGWLEAGFRIQLFPFSIAPTLAPLDKQSEVVLNNVDSLYRWRGGAWRHLNKSGDPSVTNEGVLGIGAGSGTSSTLLSNTSGANPVTINASTGLSISEVTSSNGGSVTLTNTAPDQTVSITGAGISVVTGTYPNFVVTSTEVDGSITNEGLLGVGAGGASSSALLTNTSTGAGVTINAAGIITISETTSANGGSITLAGTEVDGSISNELQTISNTSNATSHTQTLSNSGGSTQFIEGTGIGLATGGTALNGTVTITNSSPDQTVTITGAGISAVTGTYPNFTITSTEVDGSVTNEGSQTVGAGGANSSTIVSNTSGSTPVTIEGGANITVTETGSTITIAATSGSGTDLTFTGATSPYTLNSSTGTDVTFAQGTGIALSRTANELTVANSAPDQVVSITGAGINAVTGTYPTFTITGTEVDGSTSNEGSLSVGAGTGTTSIINSNTSGSPGVTVTAGSGLSISEAGNVITLTNTAQDQTVSIAGAGISVVTGTYPSFTVTSTEVDGSITNEGLLGVGAGGASSSVLLTNTSTGTGVTVNAAGILAITETTSANGGSLTLTATEVDGSVSNELQTIANTSDATSHTATLSNMGGSLKLIEGANITLTTGGTALDGTVTIAATGGADGNGFYGGNAGNGGDGTIPSVTRSTITNQQTFYRATDDTGGFVPVRVEVNGGNEPDILSLKVNATSDSILFSHSDVEFVMRATSALAIWSNDQLYLTADSIRAETVNAAFENEATIIMQSPGGYLVKSEGLDPDIIRQNGAADGDVLTWDNTTSNWVPEAPGGGGGGAPVDAQYLVLAANATLTSERISTAGENVKTTDAGAGLAYTFDVGTEAFTLKGDISPASFAVGQNDYNPAGLATSSTLRLEPTANVNLTGLQGGVDGRIIIIHNIGTGTLGIPDEDLLSAAGNRFDVGATIYIRQNLGAIFRYDGSSSRWRCVGNATYAQGCVTYEYTTPQTNTTFDILPGTKIVEFLGLGSGGGGGSGRKGLAGSVRTGGGGGGAGGLSHMKFSITDLGNPTQLRVDVGAGGNGGASQAINSTNGAAGGTGASTQLETTGGVVIITAQGGTNGGGGSTAVGAAGAGGTRAMFIGTGGAGSNATGLVGNASGANNNCTGTGGGSGGGITTANAQSAGGASGAAYYQLIAGATAGPSGGGNGQNGTAPSGGQIAGSGGAGGGSNLTGNGGSGGTGARGCGGGGGGASVNDTGNSGAGGAGGDGYCRVTLYF